MEDSLKKIGIIHIYNKYNIREKEISRIILFKK